MKCGRYKIVVASLFLMSISLPLLLMAVAGIVGITILSPTIIVLILWVSAGILVFVLYVGLVGFTANVIQFGMDQLHDSPGEDRSLFIRWHVWTYYASLSLAWNLSYQFPYNLSLDKYYNFIGYCLLALIPLIVITVLTVTLCLVRHRRRWFLIEPAWSI